ncbi:Polyadenylate-binding protein [Rhynchospora pubera]|uniref:Polyadenylate-binding protein n=1 Tax=Rhynchospora pubera TaxID=906938 RepID=A0AAV8HKS2_9POAL|nr:Polyadenylate-binding protein [Rhynchospora pubera]
MAEMQVIAPNNVAMTNAVAVAPAINGPATGSVQFPTTSLYVGDMDTNVTDSQVYETFSSVGQVVSVRVCRDVTSKRSLGYAYVNYSNANDAARAIEMLNFAPLGNKSIRIMYSNRDPSLRRSGAANIFIKNLDKAIDNKLLHDTFSVFGTILSCKVATDASGQSKGYGFVQYETDEAAKKAIGQLNGMLLNDKQVFVGPFLRKQDRENTTDKTKFNNVFVKNLAESTTKEELEEIFGKYGTITSAVVMTDENGKSRCFGFVNFENPDDAARAVQELNGKKLNDQEWYVGRAQKKAEREMELRAKFDQSAKEAADKLQGLNLYLKNLDDSISDDQLKEIFSEYGTITSCKVMKDQNGISKGSGFVAFSTTEEANRALAEMNGKMVSGKPLYVAIAQRKEDRRARLQAQFAQMQSMPMGPTMGPRMPMFPPGTPSLGQQVFYGQGPPLMAPQPGFGFQPQMVPGMRPGAPMPNFFVPYMQPGQQDPRPGGRRGGSAPLHQNQHVMPVMHNQMMQPRGRMYRYPSGRNMQDAPTPNMTGGMLSPFDMGSLPMRDSPISQSMPISTLASALANSSPDQQRMMLGESLYPLVDQLEHENAAKVTGMLLEMDQTEVLHLLESPDALKAKVAEAMDVLHNVAPHQQSNPPIDQLGALSLGDGIVA